MEPFCCPQWAHKSTIWAHERHRPQTSHSQNCFLASFGKIHAWVANKVSNLGQWEKVALFPSSDVIAKNQLAREGSQSVSPVTIPALTTIVNRQRRQDPVSGTGPEVLSGPNQRPERVSFPPFYLLQERTYLRHQTRYSLFLVETNRPTLLQTSRPTSLGLGPS